MSTSPTWYVLGLLGATIIASRVYTSWRSAARSPARRMRSAVLTAGVVTGALAPIVRLAPFASLLDGALGANTAWLVSDTLWLVAGTLGTIWANWMAPEGIERAEPNARAVRRAFWHPRTLVLALVVMGMWLAARLAPETWAGLEPGTVDLGGNLVLVAARLAYAGYMAAFLLYFVRALWRVRSVLASRQEYLRVSAALLAVVIYGASPLLQATGVLAQWLAPDPARWPALRLAIQTAQLGAGVLMLFVLGPPGLTFALLERRVAAERSAALEGLERLHAWLAARHAQVSLPGLAALRGAAREAALLAEVERAARHALAATPVATRAALAEVGERGLFVAGRGSRGASAAAALIAAALRAWPAQSSGRAPAELPRLHLIGEADARVIFWGRVAEQVEAHATAAPQPRDDR